MATMGPSGAGLMRRHAAPRGGSPGVVLPSAVPFCSALPCRSGWAPWRKAWADPRAHPSVLVSPGKPDARLRTTKQACGPWRGAEFLPCRRLGWQWPAGLVRRTPRASACPHPERWSPAERSAVTVPPRQRAGRELALYCRQRPIDGARVRLWWQPGPATSLHLGDALLRGDLGGSDRPARQPCDGRGAPPADRWRALTSQIPRLALVTC